MRILALMLVCTLSAAGSYAQTVKGTVSDTTGKAVSYATVSLKNSAAGIVAYTATDLSLIHI